MEMIQQRWVNVGNMNTKGRLFGGQMLAWVDEDTSFLAYDSVILKDFPNEDDIELTTAGLSHCQFLKPVKLADRLTFNYKVAHVGNASITFSAKVMNSKACCFFGFLTFAGINKDGVPCKISHRLVNVDIEKIRNDVAWNFVESAKKLSKQARLHECWI